ncbi:hypothetical protein Y032_0017g3276 [Ancylostoma ceylanicum]|uniref:Receptor L-domain domain-containing protein n=1 Tax=Ancylostoma ceylanicum TaxID=53326 RepID=A0A016V3P9_9BILA|nr:hypothetical protein Y032_0017g3276 [Ancylostoma ceylanicum]
MDAFRSVLHIDGSLQIRDTKNLGNIDFFSQLHTIGNWELDEPALQIVNNTGLISFDCESLVSLQSSDRAVAVIEENPDLSQFTKQWLQLISHPMYLDIEGVEISICRFNTSSVSSIKVIAFSISVGDSFLYVSRVLVAACVIVFFLVIILGVIASVLRRLYNVYVIKLIAKTFNVTEDVDLDEQQKARLRKYANEVLHQSLADWKSYCDYVIIQPQRDPTYHKKPKKSVDLRKAEAQLRMMHIKMNQKRGPLRLAKLPEQRASLAEPVAEKRRQVKLTSEQEEAFAVCTRNDDDDHNLAWSGDLFSAFHKIFIGDDQGKVLRREIPTKAGEQRRLTNPFGSEIHMECKDAFIVSTNVLEFQLTVKRMYQTRNDNTISQVFTTRPMLYNGWPDDSFPKDLKALQKLLLSISLDSNRPTIVIGKSTDASCELFWMMNLVVKSVMGRATMARLSSILEACLNPPTFIVVFEGESKCIRPLKFVRNCFVDWNSIAREWLGHKKLPTYAGRNAE